MDSDLKPKPAQPPRPRRRLSPRLPITSAVVTPTGTRDRLIWAVTAEPAAGIKRVVIVGTFYVQDDHIVASYSHHEFYDINPDGRFSPAGRTAVDLEDWDTWTQTTIASAIATAAMTVLCPESVQTQDRGHLLKYNPYGPVIPGENLEKEDA